jgi:D-arginine dehydrogenase
MKSASQSSADIVIIGAGIAGASMASRLAPTRSVLLIEAEDFAGYHATGRSAAFWQESYGGPDVQPLTSASERLLEHPPADFSTRPFLSERGAFVIGRRHEAGQISDFIRLYAQRHVAVKPVAQVELYRHVAGLRSEWSEAAHEPSCRDIDVAALHQAYLASAMRAGGQLQTRARILKARHDGRMWRITTQRGDVSAPMVLNAAGAWADQVAQIFGARPVGLQPFRRTMVQLRLNAHVPASLPLIAHVGGDFYFKGAGDGRIWLSPHDETRMDPCDVSPEELDVALAIDRFQSVVDWPIAAVERKWAGLRTFAPDRLPVFGADPDVPSFIWCAGQGGFGIQTAPAISALLGEQLGVAIEDEKILAVDAAPFSPKRFR